MFLQNIFIFIYIFCTSTGSWKIPCIQGDGGRIWLARQMYVDYPLRVSQNIILQHRDSDEGSTRTAINITE